MKTTTALVIKNPFLARMGLLQRFLVRADRE